MGIKVDSPKIFNVVDYDQIGIEVDNAVDGGGEEFREVEAGVIQWLVEGSSYGGGYFSFYEVCVEVVEVEI